MTELNAKVAALMAEAMARPQSLDSALKALASAHASHELACATYGDAEARKAPKDELERIDADQVKPASEAVGEAEKAVLAAPAKDATDMVRKVNALLDEAMLPEAVESLKAQLADALVSPEDPAVSLCREWLRLDRYLNSHDVFPRGEPEPPEWQEAYERSSDLLRAIEKATPRTIEGVALMLSVVWRSSGPASRPGTEDWERDMKNPEYQLLSRVRRGAYAVAGIRD